MLGMGSRGLRPFCGLHHEPKQGQGMGSWGGATSWYRESAYLEGLYKRDCTRLAAGTAALAVVPLVLPLSLNHIPTLIGVCLLPLPLDPPQALTAARLPARRT